MFPVKQGLKEITYGANAEIVWRCVRSPELQEVNYVRIEEMKRCIDKTNSLL